MDELYAYYSQTLPEWIYWDKSLYHKPLVGELIWDLPDASYNTIVDEKFASSVRTTIGTIANIHHVVTRNYQVTETHLDPLEYQCVVFMHLFGPQKKWRLAATPIISDECDDTVITFPGDVLVLKRGCFHKVSLEGRSLSYGVSIAVRDKDEGKV